MTVDPIALALAADPTFNLMSEAERREEIAALLRSAERPEEADDPLTCALLAEEAQGLVSAPPEPEPLALGVEPCREDHPACSEPVAGNGRCMECGARRAAETVEVVLPPERKPRTPKAPKVPPPLTEQQQVERDALLYGTGFMLDGKRVDPAKVRIQVNEPEPSHGPAPGFLARYKAASRASDRELGDVLNLARSSVQAIVGGRVGENLNPSQLLRLKREIAAQQKALAELSAELGV